LRRSGTIRHVGGFARTHAVRTPWLMMA
jgi:hypothetical protein